MESTTVLATKLGRANRRGRTAFMIGCLVVIGIFSFWVLESHKACVEKTGKPAQAITSPAAEAVDQNAWIVHPGSPTATVRITVDKLGKTDTLTVDGRPLAKQKIQTLELDPGRHLLVAEIHRVVLQQYLTVRAGEEFGVDFDGTTKNVKLTRVPAGH